MFPFFFFNADKNVCSTDVSSHRPSLVCRLIKTQHLCSKLCDERKINACVTGRIQTVRIVSKYTTHD